MKYIHNGTDQVFALYNAYATARRCMERVVSAEKGFCAGRKGLLCWHNRGFVLAGFVSAEKV